MRSRANKRVRKIAALHWITFYAFVHGTLPRDRSREAEELAIADIVDVQCHGDEARALSLIEEIVRARIDGDTLATRYASYWWHIETGQPKCWQTVPQAIAREIRERIRANVAGAA